LTIQPPSPKPNSPTVPLTQEARAAYEKLYDECELAIQGTIDPNILQVLNDAEAPIVDILDKDDVCRLEADTVLFQELRVQINDANETLKDLKSQIAAIASHIATAGEILAAIDKVLTIVP
jgi:predicted P-loop ATPase/GTPase